MRIVVVGPGALGTLFASILTLRSGHEIWLLDHDYERAADLGQREFCLVEGDLLYPLHVQITTNTNRIGVVDLILLCVKSADVEKSLALILPLVSEENLLVSLQNGISHHQILREGYPGCWAVGVTSQGASLVSPGVVRCGGSGPTFMGFLEDTRENWPLLAEFARILNTAGLEVEVTRSILIRVWRKLIINVGINALSVLLDCPNGQILDSFVGRERMARAVKEAALVAKAKGIDVGEDPVAMTEEVCSATAKNISSMLQDVRVGRSTEIQSINGAVVQEATRLKIAVPENKKLLSDVLALELSGLHASLN